MFLWWYHACVLWKHRCKPMQPSLPQHIFVFHFSPTHCLCHTADSEVTNALKVPVARGKTVKQNYMLERSFIIVDVVICLSSANDTTLKLKVNCNIKEGIKTIFVCDLCKSPMSINFLNLLLSLCDHIFMCTSMALYMHIHSLTQKQSRRCSIKKCNVVQSQ